MTSSMDNAPPESSTTDTRAETNGTIIARPDGRFRLKHFLMAIALIAGGCWFAYDGWINWPRQNIQVDQLQAEKWAAQHAPVRDEAKVEQLSKALSSVEKHDDVNILLQKILAVALPLLGIFWAGWTLRDTRGYYRLEGDTLHAPGHPPIALSDIRRIDKRRWERKGIAYLHYEQPAPGRCGMIRLDDFAYQREPTDAIFKRIEQAVTE